MPLLSLPLAILATALAVTAQTPAYTGDLLIETGNNAGKCLTAASNSNGAAVTISTCTGADAQKWKFEGGSVKVFGSKCLDVIDGKNVNGQKLQIWTCASGNKNQQWYYTPWGDNHLAWTDHGRCMDLTDGKLTDGNRPQIWDCSNKNANQIWTVGYMYNQLPATSQSGQYGTNNCGTSNSQSSKCQTGWINAVDDFCLWGPPEKSTIGDSEQRGVAYCTKRGRGTRLIPDGTLKGVHFVKTPDYVQITGVGDFTKINVPGGDSGGEYDPHGPDNRGNPVGALLYGNSFGNGLQYHEWTSFLSDGEFCIRACTGPNAARNCQHIYDVMGCYWNMPANYDSGKFESCKGDNDEPMGVYGTSTWHQGVKPTPAAHSAAKSSSCTTYATIGQSNLRKKRHTSFEKAHRAHNVVEARATPAPL
ncbi:carbohydrate-binding module family 13 protein [Flagelloscypha sp. PMI_526]|nr:carbohydrate-binding module family 13 protein [Flagelloscypha sp. PMI_526]